LSVVIPCFNSLPHLTDALDALSGERPDFEWEVVVSDDGSTDGSQAAAQRYIGLIRLIVIQGSAPRGAAQARNVGAAAANGHYLVFLDADDLIVPGYLAAMYDGLRKWGFVAAKIDWTTLNPRWAVQARQVGLGSGADGQDPPMVGAGLMGISRTVFHELGGFDASMPAAEDWDFCWRVQRDRQLPLHLCDAVLRCRLRRSPGAMFNQGRHYGRGDACLYQKWHSSGMARPRARIVGRRWLSSLAHLALGPVSRMHRARGMFLLGLSLGRLESSVRCRVLYL
jgi:glycosyltransferase involved in cell wall biosynthesis